MRPQSYEDPEETKWLESVFRGRELQNTVFCVLAPDGKKQLTRSGRSPSQIFDGPEDFAEFMESTFEKYESKAKEIRSLPVLDEFALALNVAACDGLPLVVVRASSKAELAKAEAGLSELAWSEASRGQAHYFSFVGKEPEAAKKAGAFLVDGKAATPDVGAVKAGITIFDPGTFGLEPLELAHVKLGASQKKLAEVFKKTTASWKAETKTSRQHRRDARGKGVSWSSELPITDSKSRGKRRR